jgi:hypothetical protein
MIEKMNFAANILNSLLIESDEIAIGQSEISPAFSIIFY